MANMHVDYQQIADVAKQLESGRVEIETKLNALKTKVDALVSSGFMTDSSSGAFSERYAQLTISINNTCNSITGMANFLTGTANALSETDKAIAKNLQG